MMLLTIDHDGDLSEMPPEWKIWREMMPHKTRRVYERLCLPEYAESNEPVSLHVLSTQLGISRTAIIAALDELEKMDFISQFEDEGVVCVTVSSPPSVTAATEQAYSIKGASIEAHVNERAKRILAEWRIQFEKYTDRQWKPWTADEHIARRLCKFEPDTEMLIKLIRFYWLYMHSGEAASFASFRKNYDTIAARASDFDRNG